ncbi:MAG: hypothetical protein FJW34_07385 [Acidobacteria bacterium]|nr:hypothetical protein [Acidobacteriota bacterium]
MCCWAPVLVALAIASGAAAQSADDFFDPSGMHEIRLTVREADWLTLRERYMENIYFPCEFEWRGIVKYNTGIRSRGYGSRNPIKPGLRVDFDRYDEEDSFLGLKSVQLKNSLQDASFLKERLSMQFFRVMGLPSPRVAHARVYLNGRYAGIYVVVESVDKRYLTRHFGEDSGYLYEYAWDGPYSFEYRGPDPGAYVPVPFKPQTREKDPNPGPLVDLIRLINQAPDEEFPQAMAPLLDLQLYMKQAAIESYLGEIDGIVGDSGLANFYLYGFARRSGWQFLAWDKDNTFRDPERLINRNWDTNVLMRRAGAVPELRAAYLATLAASAALAGAAEGWLDQEIRRMYRQIREAVYTDELKQCSTEVFGVPHACSNEDFEQAVEHLLKYTRERYDYIRNELVAAGCPWPEVNP